MIIIRKLEYAFFVVATFLFVLTPKALAWNHMKSRLRATIEGSELNSLPFGYAPKNEDRGFVSCAGMHLIPDLFRAVYEFRVHWNLYLPVTIYHCNELDLGKLHIFDELRNVQFVDLCPPGKELIFGMSRAAAAKRLRGFFCKIAALISAPYKEVIVMDLDTVFFKNPARLFETELYKQTGAYFFRDRTLYASIYEDNGQPMYNVNQVFFDIMQEQNIKVDQRYVEEQYRGHGVSYWWRCLRGDYWANASFAFKTCVGQYQESSVVIIDKTRHPRYMALMEHYLPSLSFGYSEKEMFWVVGHLSNESWTFEPFHAAQYGDCSGFVLHFDPDDHSKPLDKVTPFYINGEFLIEYNGKMRTIGSYVARSITAPMRIEPDGPMPRHNNCFLRHFRENNCTCGTYPCMTPPQDITLYVLRAQWITLSLRLQQQGDAAPDTCIPVLVEHMHNLQRVFSTFPKPFDRKECYTVGCPLLPLLDTSRYNVNDSVWLPSVGRTCEPVVFDDRPYTEAFKERVAAHRKPLVPHNLPFDISAPGTLIQCALLPSLYRVGDDRRLHQFPNWNTFVKLGYDTSAVKRVSFEDCENLVYGETIPEV